MVDNVLGMSIDIGLRNLCVYIEIYNIKILQEIQNVAKFKRYNNDGTTTKIFDQLLRRVYLSGKTIYINKIDIRGKNNTEIIINLQNFLDSINDKIINVEVILIEEQMKTNNLAKKIEHYCESYFVYNYLDTKSIIIFKSINKTKILGMPRYSKKMKYYQKKKYRKDWSCSLGQYILELRSDDIARSIVDENKKKDDFCDAIIQFQAFKYMCYVDKYLNWLYYIVYII